MVQRRHFHFLIPLFIGWAVGVGRELGAAASLSSSTLILVEQPTMPKDYVTPNINDDLQATDAEHHAADSESHQTLLHIIDRFNLYWG